MKKMSCWWMKRVHFLKVQTQTPAVVLLNSNSSTGKAMCGPRHRQEAGASY